MDQKGSLIDTHLKIYPSKKLVDFLTTLPKEDNLPANIRLIVGNDKNKIVSQKESLNVAHYELSDKDIDNLNKIKNIIEENNAQPNNEEKNTTPSESNEDESSSESVPDSNKDNTLEEKDNVCLNTEDIDWLYKYLVKRRSKGDEVPYLHAVMEGCMIKMPANETIKRNPELEARCVKLRAQQEARDYRKMTKGVDNVRMRFPEDSISYQLKQLNRQLIAIGQFLLSIFAGFLFGFRGVEWMVGNLDFGFRLLLGVMCALVIALAEIYFLAKKLNEELSVPETVQIGGPPKFADERNNYASSSLVKKDHQD